jgi:hypothetical protein
MKESGYSSAELNIPCCAEVDSKGFPIATFIRSPAFYLLTIIYLRSDPAHLIVRLHNLITPSCIPKLTPFTLLPPIRFLESSSM